MTCEIINEAKFPVRIKTVAGERVLQPMETV